MLQIICGVCVLALAACARNDSDDLATTYSANLAVAGNTPTVVTLHLAPGTYLIEAREQDIDLRMLVDGGTGGHAEIEDAVPRHGLHVQVASLKSAGDFRIELRSLDHRAKHGSVSLRAARWRRAENAAPGERELGYAAFGLAGAQTAAGKRESWEKAAALLNEAAAHFELARDDVAQAQTQYTLGHLQYLLIEDRLAAIRAAEAATEAYEDIDDEVGIQSAATLRAASELEIASAMNASTQRAAQRALYDAADRRLAEAAEFFGKRGLAVNAEYAVNMRGVRAIYLGEDADAAKFFTQAVEMARANKDVGEEVTSLANLGWVHYRIGFIAEAAREYSQLLPLIERDLQPALYAAILNNYGFCLIALGDFDRALQLHTDALQMYVAQDRPLEQAVQLSALGGLYFRTGDLQRSLETLRSAIEVQERIGDTAREAPALRVAGNAASAMGQHDLALEYLRKSVQIDANPQNVARSRALIASELRALGDLRGAEAELVKALESANPLSRAEALAERGRLRLVQKNFPAAIADLRAADKQYVALGLEFNRIDTNTALSQALLASNDASGAIAAADEAVSIVGRIRVKSANPEWRARFLSARYLPYEVRIAAEFAADGKDDNEKSWRAFQIAENVRARSLADLLADEPHRGARALDPKGDALRAQLTSQQLRLETRMQSADADDSGTQEFRRAIVETRAQIDAHRVSQDSVAAGSSTLTNSLQELQSRLPPDTVVLAYFVGDATTHAWLLRRNELRHAVLTGRADLASVTDEFVEAQRYASTAARDAGGRLLGGLLNGVTEKRMLVIPDGPLNGLPFAAVPLPGTNHEVLVDRFVLGYSPSLALALQGTHAMPSRGKHVAVVFDPVYAADDRRLIASGGKGGTLRGPLPVSPNKLTRLPYSALEARAVSGALGATDTLQISGFEATGARVLRLAQNDLSVLHFATHAAARADAPEQSALYLSEYSPDGALLTDSKLTVNEIRAAGLRADLVVLSGCDTGDGGRLRGEGVLGLAYGFLANGSRSVVAALWPIEDAATARFMNEFYSAYRLSGRAADALRAAQLRTRGSANAAVWSSFVVRANEFP
ncbi:MAG TPA: CHAT domain-containing tetratricopeptide repeat protein [Steroidobacteraceae bacterium]|nr:CHAT domain-containing tetratricopeptide repeat protein [Steroidobacteraceae bacterium]